MIIEAEIKVLSCKGIKDSLEVSEELFGFDLSQPFEETELDTEDDQCSTPGNNRKRVMLFQSNIKLFERSVVLLFSFCF